uniref:D-aminoacyl-tRNA deacylase n=1 Tax=Clastoptera arizonana TaxID=38151 RepID=A0A1B6CTD4_9HEMI
MRAVIRRMERTRVTSRGSIVAIVGTGLIVYIGLCKEDSTKDIDYLADKVLNIKVYGGANDTDPWTKSVMDKGYEVLVISQVQLYNKFKGGTPTFNDAMDLYKAPNMFRDFVAALRKIYSEEKVKEGKFQGPEIVDEELVNALTFNIETPKFTKDEA